MGPLIPQEIITGQWDFVIALLIGGAFGFILEASGFSSSRNIAGVFYGYNFVVLRVFFTAMIVAMVGLLYFSYFGWIDLDLVFVLPTYLNSMLFGGFLMGLGFVIGGFCPGTSYTAVAIGKIDGIVFATGFLIGVFLFAEGFPFYEDFYTANDLGNITIGEMFGISNEWIAFLFVVVAIVAFYVTWLIEKRVRKNMTEYKFE
ncbi:MAG: sulfurtransferase [Bacteroidetes bacterium]|nr:MAG: sulfurtransferase [Bacteroidota bacterium]RLD48954.1 MAG: sulfurtransferase [Bacteroidota bacterium]RLD72563.1 MAG: sulfurtransferase [Bacteroidota bacterium]RLD88211.1 MAG: sulfurtransferase [Bacteroidota bacterium]